MPTGPRSGPYLATTGTKAYAIHRPECIWAPFINAPPTLIFDTLDEARRATRKVPCNTCREVQVSRRAAVGERMGGQRTALAPHSKKGRGHRPRPFVRVCLTFGLATALVYQCGTTFTSPVAAGASGLVCIWNLLVILAIRTLVINVGVGRISRMDGADSCHLMKLFF